MSDSTQSSRQQFHEQEVLLERFEQAWHEPNPPDIKRFVDENERARSSSSLVELIAIDMEYRWMNGEPVATERYLDLFSKFKNHWPFCCQLIENECRIRQRVGVPVSTEELRRRFGSRIDDDFTRLVKVGDANHFDLLYDIEDESQRDSLEMEKIGDRHDGERNEDLPDDHQDCVRIGRYDLIERLGHGGFATVWRAWDRTIGRYVALKIPHDDILQVGDTASRTQREIESAAQLNHPSIVPILEVGRYQDRWLIVYQLIEGQTLAERIRDGRIEWRQVVQWLAQLSEAVAVAHRMGVIHRDIKPANILIDPSSRPLLTDFGLACMAGQQDRLTREGDLVGTIAYMAPERLSDAVGVVDPRCDIYGLGAVMYELLAGRPPFAGSPVSIVQQLAEHEPAALRRIDRRIPRDVETVCQTALAKSPSQRYQTAEEMTADLRALLESRPIEARRANPLERLALWCRRQPLLAGTIAAATLICILIATIGFVQVVKERNRFALQRDEAILNLYQSLINEAVATTQAKETGWQGRALQLVHQAKSLGIIGLDEFELRNVAIDALTSQSPVFRQLAEWESPFSRIDDVSISPGMNWSATVGNSPQVAVRMNSGEMVQTLLSIPNGSLRCVAFSPDGRWLAAGSTVGEICLWDKSTWKLGQTPPTRLRPDKIFAVADGELTSLTWALDGQFLAAACDNGSVQLVFVGDAEPWTVREMTRHQAAARCVSFFPDGVHLVSGGDDRSVRVTNILEEKQVAVWYVPDEVRALSVSPKGDEVLVVQPVTYGLTRITTGFGQSNVAAASDMSGELRDYPVLHRSSVSDVCAVDPDGSFQMGRPILAWSSSSDGSVRLWDTQMNQVGAIAGDYAAVTALDFHADSVSIVMGHSDGTIRMWQCTRMDSVETRGFGIDLTVLPNGDIFDSNALFSSKEDGTVFQRPLDKRTVRLMALDKERGRLAVSCAEDINQSGTPFGLVELWDISTRQVVDRWLAHDEPIIGLGWNEVTQQWITASRAGEVAIWNTDATISNRFVTQLEPLAYLLIDHNSSRIAVIGSRRLQCWDLSDTSNVLYEVEFPDAVVAACVNGGVWAVANQRGEFEIRSFADGLVRATLPKFQSPVVSMTLNPVGQRLAIVTTDHRLHVCDLDTGAISVGSREFSGRDGSYLTWLESRDWLVHCDRATHTVVWDVVAERHVASLLPVADRLLVEDSSQETIYLAATSGGVRIAPIAAISSPAESGSESISITGRRVDMINQVIPVGHVGQIWGTAASPDGHHLVTTGHDGRIKLWDRENGQILQTLEPDCGLAWCAAFSPDRRWLVAGTATREIPGQRSAGQIHWFDLEQEMTEQVLPAHQRMVVSLAFHPQLPWLISSGMDGELRLWQYSSQIDSCQVIHVNEYFPRVAFHPSGEYLVGANKNHRLAVWSKDKLNTILKRHATRIAGNLAVESDLQPSVSKPRPRGTNRQSSDEPESHAIASVEPTWLDGHHDAVWAICFSSDGRWMASGTERGDIILWRCDNWQKLAVIRNATVRIRGLAFSPDATHLHVSAYAATGLTISIESLRNTLRTIDLDWD